MTCKECQSMVSVYLGNHLKGKELEAFLAHVKKCPKCYDELETYFIIGLATRVLDDHEEVSYNIRALLKQDLDRQEALLRKKKRNRTLLFLLILLLLAFGLEVILRILGVLEFPPIF